MKLKQMNNMELKDKILLSTPDNCAMQPHKLGGDKDANLNAIRQLRIDRLVKVVGDSNGGIINFELTDLGKIRKVELMKTQK